MQSTETIAARVFASLSSQLRVLSSIAVTLLLTFIGLTAVTFTIGRVMPADPVLAVIGDRAPQAAYDRVYKEMGLDVK